MPIKLIKKPAPPDTEAYDIHVKLDRETYLRVRQLATEEDRPLSVMARRIIHLWLNKHV